MENRKLNWTWIISVLAVAFLCLEFGLNTVWAGEVNDPPEEKHIVTCDDPFTCIRCGYTGEISSEDIEKQLHTGVLCAEPDVCQECGEKGVTEDEVYEFIHDTYNEKVHFKQYDEEGHILTCWCGKVEDTNKYSYHLSACASDDWTICEGCGYKGSDVFAPNHKDSKNMHDELYHWKECTDCGDITVPKTEHFTRCENPGGPCVFCDLSDGDGIILKDKNRGIHGGELNRRVFDGEGNVVHQIYCTVCETVLGEHKEFIYTDYGNDKEHGMRCICGQTFPDEPHTALVLSGVVEATCTEPGYSGDKVCGLCKHLYEAGSEISPLGHEYVDGKCIRCGIEECKHPFAYCNDLTTCGKCGATIEAGTALSIKHKPEGIIRRGTKDATCTEAGCTGDLVCKDCGHVFEESIVIKALGHEFKDGKCIRCGLKNSDVPATGDSNDMGLWIMLMLAAFSGIVVVVRKLKKEY